MTQAGSHPVRSALYLPALNKRAIDKARTLPADAVIFDLEDAVAPGMKAEARRNLEEAFAAGTVAGGINVIRVNSLGSGDLVADLETVRKCRPHALLLPKVSGPDDVAAIWKSIGERPGTRAAALWCMIETAHGLLRVADIASTCVDGSPAVECLVMGTNDIARETGVSTANGRPYMLAWLMSAVLAAKANRVSILDGVWNDFKDATGFDAEARQACQMGFDGKTLIHPTQVEAANRIFAPSPEAVQEAQAIVSAFALPANAGKGVINMDGRMVELLHLEMAQRVLEKDRAIRSPERSVS